MADRLLVILLCALSATGILGFWGLHNGLALLCQGLFWFFVFCLVLWAMAYLFQRTQAPRV